MRALGFMRGRPRDWLSRQRFFTVLWEMVPRAGSLRSKPVCEVFLLRFVAIARHGNVFSGGNEGERW